MLTLRGEALGRARHDQYAEPWLFCSSTFTPPKTVSRFPTLLGKKMGRP